MKLARLRRFGARIPRWVRLGPLLLLSSYVVYLAAANVILRTHLLRGWLGKHEATLKVDYRAAWSLYPGHVEVRDLLLRSQDRNVQMSLGIERASVRIDLWSLTHRLARFDRVSAEGVVYRMRLKQESVDGNEGRVSAFPPIAGFADPPLVDAAPEPPRAEDGHEPWTVELREVSASVSDVWIMEVRFRGAATLRGGFVLQPQRKLCVSPSVMNAPLEGLLSLGDRELIHGGAWRLEAEVEPFDPRVVKGTAVLRHVRFRLHEHGGIVSLASIGQTYFPDSRVVLERGAGPVGIDVHVDHGVVQPESRVTYVTNEAVLSAAPFAVQTDVAFAARVESGERSRIVAEASTKHANVTPAMDVRGVRATFDIGTADLAEPIAIPRITFAVKSAHVADLHAWQPIAKHALAFDGGATTFTTRGDYHAGTFDGRIDMTLDKVAMSIGPFRFVSSGTTSTNVESEDIRKSIAFPGARADLHDLAIRLLDGHAQGMWLRARSDDTRVATSGATATDMSIAVESGPGDETVKLFTRIASLPDLTADVTHGTQLDAVIHIRVRHDDIALGVLHARNGVLQGRGRLHKAKGHRTSGAFVFSVGPLDSGLDIQDGHVAVKPFRGGAWLDETLQKR